MSVHFVLCTISSCCILGAPCRFLVKLCFCDLLSALVSQAPQSRNLSRSQDQSPARGRTYLSTSAKKLSPLARLRLEPTEVKAESCDIEQHCSFLKTRAAVFSHDASFNQLLKVVAEASMEKSWSTILIKCLVSGSISLYCNLHIEFDPNRFSGVPIPAF